MKKHSISFNYIMNTTLTISSILFPLISFPYVSRVLNPDGIGRVSFAMSFISYFSMIAQLGIPTYGIRECAKFRDDQEQLSTFVKEIILINSITCIITYIAFIICVLSINRLRSDKTLFVVMSCSIIFNAAGLEWLYKGLEEYAYITKRSILFKCLAFVGMFLLIRSENDVLIYGILTIFASVGSNLCNWINARKYVSFKGIHIGSLKKHMKPIIVFFLLSIASTIYTNLDNVMLGFITDDKEVGLYTSATKVKAALVSIVTSLGTVLLPRASYCIENNNMSEFDNISRKSLAFTSMLALPFMVYFSVVSKSCVLALSGKNYLNSVGAMVILMPTVFLIGISNIIGMQILVPLGKEKIVFFSVLGGAITDFLINIIMIPIYGALGAAVGTVVAEFVVLVIQFIGYRKKTIELFKSIQWWKMLVATVIPTIIIIPIMKLSIGHFTKLIISCIIYYLIYACLLLFFKETTALDLKEKILSRIRGN